MFSHSLHRRAQQQNVSLLDDCFNTHSFDDTWRIGCDNDYLREEKWPALRSLVNRFLTHLAREIDTNPLLYPWIDFITSENGQDLHHTLLDEPWTPPQGDMLKLLRQKQISEDDLFDATLNPSTGMSSKVVMTSDGECVAVEFWDLSCDD